MNCKLCESGIHACLDFSLQNTIAVLSAKYYLCTKIISTPVCRFVLAKRKVRATQGTIFPNGKLFVRAG